jgi:hypothetical protein
MIHSCLYVTCVYTMAGVFVFGPPGGRPESQRQYPDAHVVCVACVDARTTVCACDHANGRTSKACDVLCCAVCLQVCWRELRPGSVLMQSLLPLLPC